MGGYFVLTPLGQQPQRGQRKSARQSKHEQKNARQYACMRGHAVQSKCIVQRIVHRPACSCELLASSTRLVRLRVVSEHKRKSRAHGRRCSKRTAMYRRMMSTAGERLSLQKVAPATDRRRVLPTSMAKDKTEIKSYNDQSSPSPNRGVSMISRARKQERGGRGGERGRRRSLS